MKSFNRKLHFLLLMIVFIFPLLVNGQESNVEMADMMRQNGKIYVVVSVVSIILLGFLIALINLDRKVKKIENQKRKE